MESPAASPLLFPPSTPESDPSPYSSPARLNEEEAGTVVGDEEEGEWVVVVPKIRKAKFSVGISLGEWGRLPRQISASDFVCGEWGI